MYKSVLLLIFLVGLNTSLQAEVSLSFNDYWMQVRESNLTIKDQKSLIKYHEKNPALEIPAPELSISQMNESLPFSSKAKMIRTLELSQSIPFLSKFSNARDIKVSNIKKIWKRYAFFFLDLMAMILFNF